MAVVNTKSSAITNADATPRVPNNAFVAGTRLHEAVGTAEGASGDSIGSTYRLIRIKSGARVSALKLYCDAISTSGAADIGVYRTAADGGAAVSASLFGSAVVLTSALANSDVTYEATATNISKIEQRLWELLGLSADPFLEYDIVATLTAAAGGAGTICLKVQYADG